MPARLPQRRRQRGAMAAQGNDGISSRRRSGPRVWTGCRRRACRCSLLQLRQQRRLSGRSSGWRQPLQRLLPERRPPALCSLSTRHPCRFPCYRSHCSTLAMRAECWRFSLPLCPRQVAVCPTPAAASAARWHPSDNVFHQHLFVPACRLATSTVPAFGFHSLSGHIPTDTAHLSGRCCFSIQPFFIMCACHNAHIICSLFSSQHHTSVLWQAMCSRSQLATDFHRTLGSTCAPPSNE